MGEIKNRIHCTPAGELWRLVPPRDRHGRRCSDFMMLLPSLRGGELILRQHTLSVLKQIYARYGERVVYADLNLELNLLWVSVEGVPGLCREVAWAIQDAIPNALLVGSYFGERPRKLSPGSRMLGWFRPRRLPLP